MLTIRTRSVVYHFALAQCSGRETINHLTVAKPKPAGVLTINPLQSLFCFRSLSSTSSSGPHPRRKYCTMQMTAIIGWNIVVCNQLLGRDWSKHGPIYKAGSFHYRALTSDHGLRTH